jgi:nucleotide-binding universal stress UspA family protein
MLPIRTILYPTDFSARADHALPLARALARDYGAKLIVAHVNPPPIPMGELNMLTPDPAGEREARKNRLADYRVEDPAIAVEHVLLDGDAATEIAGLAGERGVDLIVMGTHGRTGLGRLLLGSVAEGVLRKAPCPVLTLKTPMREAVPAAEAKLCTA